MNKIMLNIPKKTFWYLMICGGVIIIFILGGIIPLYQYNAGIKNDIKKLQVQIEEQKQLQVAYSSLISFKGKSDLRILPNPARTTLPRQDTLTFQDVFKETAIKAGLKTVSLTPELNTPAGSSTYLLHSAVVKGEFGNFRKMLIELSKIPYLDKIDEIRIQQNPEAMEFGMKIWIALGS